MIVRNLSSNGVNYHYIKIIARRAFDAQDGKAAKARSYGFIKKTFRELQSGTTKWSEITREDWQLVESDRKCTGVISAGH